MPCNYKHYPENWKQIRQQVLDEQGHRCAFCHVANYEHIIRGKWNGQPCWLTDEGQVYSWPEGKYLGETYLGWIEDGDREIRVVLTVAHLDHDNTNTDRQNLAGLCQKCLCITTAINTGRTAAPPEKKNANN